MSSTANPVSVGVSFDPSSSYNSASHSARGAVGSVTMQMVVLQLLKIQEAAGLSPNSAAAPWPIGLRPEDAARYLAALVQENWVDDEMPSKVFRTLSFVHSIDPSLPIPDMGPTSSGRVILSWDRDDRHLEAEVLQSGDVEFFYRNRETGELWDEDVVLNAATPLQTTALRRRINALMTGR